MRTISISIPNYNRTDMVIEAFEKVYDDERVSEIVISDDCSDLTIYNQLVELFKNFTKVRMYRNAENYDCYKNKMKAVGLSFNEWAILLDSDNIISPNYLYEIYSIPVWDSNTIYTPSFAAPNFDFRKYEGIEVTKQNVSAHIGQPMFETMLNAANFFVNRDEYLKVWDASIDPVTSDSIYMVYRWLSAGNKIKVVPSLTYQHRVHSGSHYQNNQHRTPQGFHQSIIQKLKELR